MAISTGLFTEKQLDNFDKITTKIEKNQAKVISGKSLTEPAEDPEKAIKVSALDEKLRQTDNFISNLGKAGERLGVADTVMGNINNILIRLGELAIQAANDTYTEKDRLIIQMEVKELKNELLSLANTHDSRGQPLFSGSSGKEIPFSESLDGSVVYSGNNQRTFVRTTNNTTVADSLSGSEVFFSDLEGNKRVSYFDIVDNFIESLEIGKQLLSSASVDEPDTQVIKLNSSDKLNNFSFDMRGQFGLVTVKFVSTNNGISEALAAINLHTSLTGITAQKDASGEGIKLTNVNGEIEISNFSDGSQFGDINNKISIISASGEKKEIVNSSKDISRNIQFINSAQENNELKRAAIGSMANQIQNSLKVNENMRDLFQKSFSDLESADLERIITELQSLLVNRDVARQTYTKITQTTLFDYIR